MKIISNKKKIIKEYFYNDIFFKKIIKKKNNDKKIKSSYTKIKKYKKMIKFVYQNIPKLVNLRGWLSSYIKTHHMELAMLF